MSTLKTNNIEHLDASSPSIQIGVGGGVNISGVTTVGNNLTIDGNNRNITTGVGQTVGFGTDISIDGNLVKDGNSFVFPSSGGTLDRLERAGNILQVVNSNTTTSVNNATISFIATGLSAAITPTSTTSKILVLVNQTGTFKNTTNTWLLLKLFRNAVDLSTFGAVVGYTNNSNESNPGACSCCYLDSPNTTSSITYSTKFANSAGSGSVGVQRNSSMSTITLMEVSA